MARYRRSLLTVLVAVLSPSAIAVATLNWPTSYAAAAVKAAVRVELKFHYANLPANSGGTVTFTKGVVTIPAQTALVASNSPGAINFFWAQKRGFTVEASSHAPLDADIAFIPELAAHATVLSGHADVPQGASLTVHVGGAEQKIDNGEFSIGLTPLGKLKR